MAHGKICMAADVSAVAMTPNLGAEVRGVDLSAPLSDACCARIMEIFHRYCVIFFRNQQLESQHLLRFAARFGEPEIEPVADRQLTGLPPNVLAWLPGGQSITSPRAMIAPSGIPLAIPLARQTMSGSIPQCSTA